MSNNLDFSKNQKNSKTKSLVELINETKNSEPSQYINPQNSSVKNSSIKKKIPELTLDEKEEKEIIHNIYVEILNYQAVLENIDIKNQDKEFNKCSQDEKEYNEFFAAVNNLIGIINEYNEINYNKKIERQKNIYNEYIIKDLVYVMEQYSGNNYQEFFINYHKTSKFKLDKDEKTDKINYIYKKILELKKILNDVHNIMTDNSEECINLPYKTKELRYEYNSFCATINDLIDKIDEYNIMNYAKKMERQENIYNKQIISHLINIVEKYSKFNYDEIESNFNYEEQKNTEKKYIIYNQQIMKHIIYIIERCNEKNHKENIQVQQSFNTSIVKDLINIIEQYSEIHYIKEREKESFNTSIINSVLNIVDTHDAKYGDNDKYMLNLKKATLKTLISSQNKEDPKINNNECLLKIDDFFSTGCIYHKDIGQRPKEYIQKDNYYSCQECSLKEAEDYLFCGCCYHGMFKPDCTSIVLRQLKLYNYNIIELIRYFIHVFREKAYDEFRAPWEYLDKRYNIYIDHRNIKCESFMHYGKLKNDIINDIILLMTGCLLKTDVGDSFYYNKFKYYDNYQDFLKAVSKNDDRLITSTKFFMLEDINKLFYLNLPINNGEDFDIEFCKSDSYSDSSHMCIPVHIYSASLCDDLSDQWFEIKDIENKSQQQYMQLFHELYMSFLFKYKISPEGCWMEKNDLDFEDILDDDFLKDM